MSLLKPWYISAGEYALQKWRWWVYPLIILSIFFTGYCGIQSCSKSKEAKKEQELRDDENLQKGELNILKELEANANLTVEQSGINSNRAGNNFNTTLNRNSTEFNSNYSTVKRKFCASHPADPACQGA